VLAPSPLIIRIRSQFATLLFFDGETFRLPSLNELPIDISLRKQNTIADFRMFPLLKELEFKRKIRIAKNQFLYLFFLRSDLRGRYLAKCVQKQHFLYLLHRCKPQKCSLEVWFAVCSAFNDNCVK
jgi:hypothetical protein